MTQPYSSLRHFGARLGLSHTAVDKYRRRDDWPIARNPPWSEADAGRVEAWRKTHIAPRPQPLPESDDLVPRAAASPVVVAPARSPPVPPGSAPADPIAELRLSPERMARVRLLITKQAKLELERLILAEQYIDKAGESRRDIGKILACKAALVGMARRLPDLLVGKTAQEMRPIVLTEVERILNAFAGNSYDEHTGTDD